MLTRNISIGESEPKIMKVLWNAKEFAVSFFKEQKLSRDAIKELRAIFEDKED